MDEQLQSPIEARCATCGAPVDVLALVAATVAAMPAVFRVNALQLLEDVPGLAGAVAGNFVANHGRQHPGHKLELWEKIPE